MAAHMVAEQNNNSHTPMHALFADAHSAAAFLTGIHRVSITVHAVVQ